MSNEGASRSRRKTRTAVNYASLHSRGFGALGVPDPSDLLSVDCRSRANTPARIAELDKEYEEVQKQLVKQSQELIKKSRSLKKSHSALSSAAKPSLSVTFNLSPPHSILKDHNQSWLVGSARIQLNFSGIDDTQSSPKLGESQTGPASSESAGESDPDVLLLNAPSDTDFSSEDDKDDVKLWLAALKEQLEREKEKMR